MKTGSFQATGAKVESCSFQGRFEIMHGNPKSKNHRFNPLYSCFEDMHHLTVELSSGTWRIIGAALDDSVEPLEVIPVGFGHFGIVDDIQDRLVVFVHENHVPLRDVIKHRPSLRG